MSTKSGWTVAGILVMVLFIVGISSLSAQRFGPPGAIGHGGDVGRYVLVRNTEDAIIIMDSVSGELYRATPADIKPFAARHRFMEPPMLKDESAREGSKKAEKRPDLFDKDKIKPDFKDKEK
jgi:hypothetical protein